MKIVLLGTAHPFRGGLASYNERLAQQFIAEGDDTEIVTFKLQYPEFLFPGKSQYTDAPPPKNIKITRLLNSINPFNWITTARYIVDLKPDILVIKYWHPSMAPCFGSVARIVKRKSKKTRVVCIFDNVISHEEKFGYKLLTKYFTKCIDGAIVMSKSVGKDLAKFRTDIQPIFNPHPIFDNYGDIISRDEALAKLQLPTDYTYFLFFGFIRAYKGLDLLLQAFSDERFKDKKVKLIVAGEFYEDDAPYKKIINDNNLNDRVILLDRYIGEDEVASLFCAASLIVQPYKNATQSGVTQICYHFEKPMLVTNVGGLSEIVPDGKCGYVVEPNPTAIANAMINFLSDGKEAYLINGIREEKQRFGWDKMTSSIRKA